MAIDRARIWPSFRSEHVLFEDSDVIVIHKPAGVSSQAADSARPDDVVTRLRMFLAERDGTEDPYLGVHQRLDRDTSGVMLFTKTKQANASIARQFEERKIEKLYYASVSGWPSRSRDVTLTNSLRRAGDGTMSVVPSRSTSTSTPTPRHAPTRNKSPRAPLKAVRESSKGSGDVRAVTHVRLMRHVPDPRANASRSLLELRLETGRMHQARVQLAYAGAPIGGDVIYGGSAAPRLLLHATRLVFTHPLTGKRIEVRDELPLEFMQWVARGDSPERVYDSANSLASALALATERRWALGRSAGDSRPLERTTAFRLVNEEGDGLPGLAVDVYGDHLVAQLYASELWDDGARRERVFDALAALGFDGVYLKVRPKQANELVDTRRDDLAPAKPVRGDATQARDIAIVERGISYEVRLGDGLSTGLFLDQRGNRSLVRTLAQGARVLNLFAYTCGFSVAAALGGASGTVSVDASMVALERGRANFAACGVSLSSDGSRDAHAFVADDVFSWLARAAKRVEKFDLVVVDPPSYSNTKKRRFVAQDDYDELIALVTHVVGPGGKILASCNNRGMSWSKMRKLVSRGVEVARRNVVQLKDLPLEADFPPARFRHEHMKSVLVTLA